MKVSIKLPWPPTVNTYYSCVNNRNILSKKGREYKKQVGIHCVMQGVSKTPLISKLKVFMWFYPPDKERRNLSNHVKAVEDGLVEVRVMEDDSQIDYLTLTRCGSDSKDPRVEIVILEEEV